MDDLTDPEKTIGHDNYEDTNQRMERSISGNPKATLMTLPNEMLLEIITHIIGRNIRKDGIDYFRLSLNEIQSMYKVFIDLSGVNERLSRLISPLLYTIITKNDSFEPEIAFSTYHNMSTATAQHVKYIGWRDGGLLDSISQHADVLDSDSFYTQGLDSAVNAVFDGTLASLLHLTRNVQYLKVNGDHTYQYYPEELCPAWLNVLAEAALPAVSLSEPSICQHLRALRISLGNISLKFVSNILRLPSLRHLDLTNIDKGFEDNMISEQSWACPPKTSPITRLAVTRSFVDSEAVSQLISSMKGLEHFQLDCFIKKDYAMEWWARDWHREFPKLRYGCIGHALREHEDTLKTLEVLGTTDTYDPVFHNINTGRLGPLDGMTKLQVLSGTFQSLFMKWSVSDNLPVYRLQNVWPKTVHRLVLYTESRNSHGEMKALDDLIDVCAKFRPELKSVEVHYREKDGFINQNGFRYFERFQKLGVRLRLIEKPGRSYWGSR